MTWINTLKDIIKTDNNNIKINDNILIDDYIEISQQVETEIVRNISVSSNCLTISCKIDYLNNKIHNDIYVKFYFSPDGINYDTEPYEIIKLKSDNNTIQKTVIIPVLFRYVKISIVNTCDNPINIDIFIRECQG